MRPSRTTRGHVDPVVRLALTRGSSGGGSTPGVLGAVTFADIFGLGEDGPLVVAAPAAGFVGGDYTTFVLDPGVTLTGAADRPILIRATESITIDGTLDASALISGISPSAPMVGQQLFSAGGSGGGGGGNAAAAGSPGNVSPEASVPLAAAVLLVLQFHPVGYPLGSTSFFGSAGAGGPLNTVGGAAGASASAAPAGAPLASFRDLERIRTGVTLEQYVGGTNGGIGTAGGDGGAGAVGIPGGAGGVPVVGGNGGASIYLVAPSIVFGAGATLRSVGGNGTVGSAGAAGTAGAGANSGGGGGGGGGGGQGGSGGVIGVYWGVSTSGAFTFSVVGGLGAAGGALGAGGAAGGGPAAGGAGAAGAAGANGAPGFVFFRQIGHK